MPVTLTIHDSQYPDRVRAQLCHGLRTKSLPGKFLYDSPAQAQRWLAYHQAYSPSRTEAALVTLYQQAFDAALQRLTSAPLHYVSLGCGGGTKDLRCLQQATARHMTLSFTPMDISPALAVETMRKIQSAFAALPSFPLVVDLAATPDLAAILDQSETPGTQRLVTCFGMLPNFDYQTFLRSVQRVIRPTDILLLSANLSPLPYPDSCADIVRQYNNAPARAWFTGLLDSLGFAAADYDMHIAAHPLQDDGHVWQIRTAVQFLRDVRLALYDETFTFLAGERLQVFFSNRFTPHIMPHLLAEAGLSMLESFLFTTQEEGIYLCARAT